MTREELAGLNDEALNAEVASAWAVYQQLDAVFEASWPVSGPPHLVTTAERQARAARAAARERYMDAVSERSRRLDARRRGGMTAV